ncbi:hypothetical protein GCM10011529_21100 [Polymorphobacter glacialis]|uniref:O-antigen ligase-related domain-containing protein n=1 Tax=Sandarakinorhabdus glacialis TaxID=1614636 RepID=A0A917E877_9SPHN|nr:O-antigen ligase family protein [Polymorphobacter glacialis]GGE14488.1 hypothetical protein GCM10011529_21100 [Polymorphobacter glacialis]
MTISALPRGAASSQVAAQRQFLQRAAMLAIAGGVFFTSYLSWRPFEELFTLSDALFCMGFGLLLAAGRLPIQPFGHMTAAWLLAFAMMISALFISSLVNGDATRWLTVALQYGFALVLLPLLLMADSEDDLLLFGRALVAGVTAMEAFGILVYFFYAGSYADMQKFGPEFITGGRRLGAFLADGNWNGVVIAMTLPYVIHLRRRRAIGLYAAVIATGILGTGLVLAASFTAFAAAVLSLLIYAIVAGAWLSPRMIAAGAIPVAAVLSFGVTLPEAFGRRVAPALQHGDIEQAGTFVGRMDLVREAWEMIDHTSLLGLGVDQFRVVSIEHAPVHQIYLLLWTEGGIFALMGWLLMVFLLIATAAMAVRRDRGDAGLALAVSSTFLIASTASPHMYSRHWLVPVIIAMGFATSARQRATKGNAT